ncbi:MAG TPA: hypothetical protein DIW23_06885 [Anaerolineae bacterium]|nr:hypothetical protein [Anaerolineae bacterium]
MSEKDYSDQLEVNKILWQKWAEHGIKSNDNFKIEFHFISARMKSTNILVSELKKEGFSSNREEIDRKLLIFKKWLVTVPILKSWTLESLDEQTLQFCILADRLGIVFDGCGAYMPKK